MSIAVTLSNAEDIGKPANVSRRTERSLYCQLSHMLRDGIGAHGAHAIKRTAFQRMSIYIIT
jgi:hypothetical protein